MAALFDPNWTRWIHASCRKYFNDRKNDFKLFFLPTDKKSGLETYGEFRVNGPNGILLSTKEWQLEILINVLVTANLTNQDSDLILRSVGLIQSIMPIDLPVFKFGIGEQDDGSQLGCLKIEMGSRVPIRTTHFGQFDKNVPLLQSTVEANYQIRLP